MDSFRDSCAKLEKTLAGIRESCRLRIRRLAEWEPYVESWALNELSIRMCVLALAMHQQGEALQGYHKGKGCVVVSTREGQGMSLHWVEDERLVADRKRYAMHGLTVLSLDEAITTMVMLVGDLRSGGWPRVLAWYHAFGRLPGLDMERCLKELEWWRV